MCQRGSKEAFFSYLLLQLNGFGTAHATGTTLQQLNEEPHCFGEKVERDLVYSLEVVLSLPSMLVPLVWDGKELW